MSGSAVYSLTLTQGDPYDSKVPLVRIQTVLPRAIHSDRDADLIIERWSMVRQLVGTFWRLTNILGPEVRKAAFTPGDITQDPTDPWDRGAIRIDGDSADLKFLQHETTWVGLAERANLLIAIESQRWAIEQTGLRTVPADRLVRYEEGSLALGQRHFGPADS